MDNTSISFYRDFYRNTNGFMPSSPLSETLDVGDFFVIQNGKILRLGNIKHFELHEEIKIVKNMKLNPINWQMHHGVHQAYYTSEQVVYEGSVGDGRKKSYYTFDERGSYLFHGHKPKSEMIRNWHHLEKAVTLRLTQTDFMLREVYVATEVVSLSSWLLAIGETHEAHLEVASENEEFGFFEFLVHESAQTVRSKDLQTYQSQKKGERSFFRAKRLVMKDKAKDKVMHHILHKHGVTDDDCADDNSYTNEEEKNKAIFMTNQLNINLLNMVVANELNINTVLEFFTWCDADLDDVDKLCGIHNG